MDSREVLKFCLRNGLLLDEEILNIFKESGDTDSVKLIIEKIKDNTSKKIITKEVLWENKERVGDVFSALPPENQKKLEKLKIKLGLSIEVSKEFSREPTQNPSELSEKNKEENKFFVVTSDLTPSVESLKITESEKEFKEVGFQENKFGGNVNVVYSPQIVSKKFEVADFVNFFRDRFQEMKGFLQDRPELDNLVSINKLPGSRRNVSLIGLVSDKRTTKNNNIIFEIEDLTGRIKVLVNQNKEELYQKAEEVPLDAIIGVKGSGNGEIIFANEIVFPDIFLPERKKSPFDESVLFISDVHFGSKKFLEKGFLKLIDYINGKVPNTPEHKKIKYLFIVGDLVTGIGAYPNQEHDLDIVDLEGQYLKAADFLSRIRKDVKIIISPGNHDGVRLMEPQPMFDEKYAWPLYDLENVILTKNPSIVNIGSGEGFSGFNVFTYHGFSYLYYANTVQRLMKEKAINAPEKIIKYLFKNRHLAPTHGARQYSPIKEDPLLIRTAPDIFVSGHVHKSAVSYYNNILLLSGSCWEDMTSYQEKFGNVPDHCKVPMLNLKTREVKILDFE